MAKNIKDILLDATKFPAALEAKLPAGAPTISTMLADAAGQIPAVPDLPIDVPALPAPPEMPAGPGTAAVTVAPSPTAVRGRLGEEILS